MRAPDDHDRTGAPRLAQDVDPSSALATARSAQTTHQIKKLLQTSVETGVPETFPDGVTRDILASVMNLLAQPVLLIDRQLNVVYSNASAKATLIAGQALVIDGGQLQGAAAGLKHLKSVVGTSICGGPKPPPLIIDAAKAAPIQACHTARALCVWVHPVDEILQTSAPVWAQGLVVLIVKPVRAEAVISTSLLRSRFKLTARQAEVVKALAAGATIEQTAIDMGVSEPTVRSHLAQCFAKTGTHRQPELIGLALSLTSPIFE